MLEGGQERLHGGGGAGGGLRRDPVAVVLNRELGHLAFPVSVVEDEQREAGVAEQPPRLGRVRRASQSEGGGMLLAAEVDDQTRQGGEQGRHVMPVCAGEKN